LSERETVIGVDFSGTRLARDQRRKIIALAAVREEAGRYTITPHGFNARVIERPTQPGWTGEELAQTLLTGPAIRVAAFDFPFSLPHALLIDPAFAAAVGQAEPFGTWEQFNRFVAATLPLTPPLDLTPFAPWRDKSYWQKRATDRAARAQPPLKSKFQVVFNMTLLGNALLARLAASGRYRVVPFGRSGPPNELIEIYPGVALRALGFPAYKREPARAITILLDYCAAQGLAITLDPAIRLFCETYNSGSALVRDPDGSDALLALLAAILYREGLAVEILSPEDAALRPLEGAAWGLQAPDRATGDNNAGGRQGRTKQPR